MSEPFHPFPYQLPMIEWVAARDESSLFCSPGLGKTVVILKVLEQWMIEGKSRGALIIAPLRVCSVTWPAQIERWDHSAWMKVAYLRTPEGMQAWRDGTADVYLINPEMLISLAPKMFQNRTSVPVDTFIWDELSLCKNPSSKRVKAIRPYLHLFKQRCSLTGTPVANDYQDLWGEIRVMDDGKRLGQSFYHYRQTFFTAGWGNYTQVINPGAKEIIDTKLADLCLVMLGDDYLDLPTCNAEDVSVTLPPAALAEYKRMEKELLIELEQSEVVALSAAALCGKLLQITSGAVYDDQRGVYEIHDAKIDALKKLRKKHGKEPMLVLTAYKHEMARVLAAIPGSKRFDEKDLGAWQRGEIHTWVAQPQSLSHGVDGLQKSGRIAVWMTLTYSNETYTQTNARLVRLGQSCETIIYRLIVSGTIDDAVCSALRDKTDTQSGLLTALKALQKFHLSTNNTPTPQHHDP